MRSRRQVGQDPKHHEFSAGGGFGTMPSCANICISCDGDCKAFIYEEDLQDNGGGRSGSQVAKQGSGRS